MSSTKEFPFHKARRINRKEQEEGRKAIAAATGKTRAKRVGRPPKNPDQKYVPISLRLHPRALAWLRKEAKKRSLPYQTIINQLILREAA